MRFILLSFFVAFQAHASLTYKPAKFDPKSARLLVVIHGCLQSSESMAMGTGFNAIADSNNLAVFYPQVPPETNPLDCWNWYLPTNQISESGQLRMVRDQIVATKRLLGIPNAPTYLAGMSSGGGTVSGLIACFGDEFKAGAIVAGPMYGSARNQTEGEKVLKNGPPPTISWRPCQPAQFGGRLIVIHGNADKVVNYNTGRAHIRDTYPDAPMAVPKSLNANGMKYTQADFKLGKREVARYIEVEGLGHAWPGANLTFRHPPVLTGEIKTPFFAPTGPSATQLIWDFFKNEPVTTPKIKKVAPNVNPEEATVE